MLRQTLFILIILAQSAIGQTIHLKTNLTGRFRITNKEIEEDIQLLTAGIPLKVSSSNLLEIAFDENESTVLFQFTSIKFKKTDTLSLDFFSFHTIDTVNYNSSCKDGSHPHFEQTTLERNPGSQEISELPDSLIIRLGTKEISLYKKLKSGLAMSHGTGKKHEKSWGFSEARFYEMVIYSNE